MFLSIITPTNNSQDTISDCINSVLKQNFDDYEHIIIDNNSSDKTIKLIQDINNKKIQIISEEDKGIYFAMNKGTKIASGKYLLFLNSDDHLIDDSFFKNVYKILNNKKYDLIYSNVIYPKNKFNIKRKYKTGIIDSKIKLGWHLPHPGTIINKNFLNYMNYFDTQYQIASDFDFFFRCQLNKDTSYFYYDKFTVLMLPGGASSGLKNIIKSNIECYHSLKKNKYKNPLLFIIFKLFRKILQFN